MSDGKTLFLDRDGVINIDTGHPHLIEEIQFIEGIFDLCRMACDLGYQIIIITNQAGIAKGYYEEEQMHSVMNWMLTEFRMRGIDILDYYYCPHHVDGLGQYRKKCQSRKPAPGMILRACTDHYIDLGNSVIIGDKMSDMEAGTSANIALKILFKSGVNQNKNLIDNIKVFGKLADIEEYLRIFNLNRID